MFPCAGDLQMGSTRHIDKHERDARLTLIGVDDVSCKVVELPDWYTLVQTAPCSLVCLGDVSMYTSTGPL